MSQMSQPVQNRKVIFKVPGCVKAARAMIQNSVYLKETNQIQVTTPKKNVHYFNADMTVMDMTIKLKDILIEEGSWGELVFLKANAEAKPVMQYALPLQ